MATGIFGQNWLDHVLENLLINKTRGVTFLFFSRLDVGHALSDFSFSEVIFKSIFEIQAPP